MGSSKLSPFRQELHAIGRSSSSKKYTSGLPTTPARCIVFRRSSDWANCRAFCRLSHSVCEAGPLGSVTLPEDFTDRGVTPAARPRTAEVLAELAATISALARK
jgi:hypothetical protein